MDVTWARISFTFLIIISFFLVVWVARGKQSKQRYNDIARQIVDDDDSVATDVPKSHPDATEQKQ